MSLRYEEIAEIMKIIDSSSCDELIVETGDVKLVVRRNGGGAAPSPAVERPVSPLSATPGAASTPKPAVVDATHPSAKAQSLSGHEVIAPMVGTFYRASSPEAPPFVEVGSIVRKGQPLCLIEVMKLFTTIDSEFDGRITQISAENGELVEYGRTLFVIEPA